jgi:hypothetical protein
MSIFCIEIFRYINLNEIYQIDESHSLKDIISIHQLRVSVDLYFIDVQFYCAAKTRVISYLQTLFSFPMQPGISYARCAA